MRLSVEDAILFAPTAIVGFRLDIGNTIKIRRLGTEFTKIRGRNRLTADGEKSVMAT